MLLFAVSPVKESRGMVHGHKCKSSAHWPDQCSELLGMSIDDRVAAVKENHVCFSCLKQAGQNHRSFNYSRREKCEKSENGHECQSYHHHLLHKTNPVNVEIAAVNDGKSISYLWLQLHYRVLTAYTSEPTYY